MKRRSIFFWTIVALAALFVLVLMPDLHRWRPHASMQIQGAVIRQEEDARRELPISDVVVTASDGTKSASTQSDASGYFNLTFPGGVWPGRTVTLSFRHPDYQPLDMALQSGLRFAPRDLYVAALKPVAPSAAAEQDVRPSVVSNIRVRYTVNSESEENIGNAVKTFQVVNKGNVPCDGKAPCSPDGNWKASSGSVELDAGQDNQFRNVRASCIAGPCPFTRIDASGFASGGRSIKASAMDWSDTATFLLEAEVFRTSINSNVRESYPVVFGRALNFTLPATQEGVSLEADIDGSSMVFPLGPELYLSWATCTARTNSEQEKTTVYRCELKPGYRF